MAAKQIIYGSQARKALLKGIDGVTDAIKPTLGPAARTVVLQRKWGSPTVINDGVTIARDISFADPFVDMGAKFVQEVASNAQESSGDGTSTASILAQAICHEGLTAMDDGSNPIAITRGIRIATECVNDHIVASSIPVEESMLAEVASIAANNDEEIGILIAQAFEQVGSSGVITVEEARGNETELLMVEGTEFDKGYLSPYMVTDPKKLVVEYVDPLILLTDESINRIQELLPILEHSIKEKRPLLIIAQSVEGEALSTLVLNRIQGTLNVVAIQAPGYGIELTENIRDLGVLLGASPIFADGSESIVENGVESLGTCGRVIISKSKTTLVDGGGDTEKIQNHATELLEQIPNYETTWEKERLKKRAGSLTGGVVVLKVAAATETEMREKKARVDDSLNATRAAIEEGIIPGGGVSLLNSRSELDVILMKPNHSADEKIGIRLVRDSLSAPFRQIILNCGEDADEIQKSVEASSDWDYGFNAQTRNLEHLLASGVVDPVKVTRSALRAAASIASLVLTSEVLIADISEPEKQHGEEPPLLA